MSNKTALVNGCIRISAQVPVLSKSINFNNYIMVSYTFIIYSDKYLGYMPKYGLNFIFTEYLIHSFIQAVFIGCLSLQ